MASDEKKSLICLDFDGVLFNSVGLIFDFPEIKKIGSQEFMDAYREYRSSEEFLPENFTTFLLKRRLLNLDERDTLERRFHEIQRNAAVLLFDDVLTFIKLFPREMLAILSRAHPDWQKPNIQNSGAGALVGRIIIVQGDRGKKDALIELQSTFSPIFLIDDDPKELENVRDLSDVKTFLLNRGKIPDVTGGYKDLKEIADILKVELNL